MNRTLNVTTPLGPEVLRFDMLQGKRKHCRTLFDFQLTMKSDGKGLSAEDCSGQSGDRGFRAGWWRAPSYLNGQCVHFRSAGRRGQQHLYIASCGPGCGMRRGAATTASFQNKSAPDIVKEVLAGYPFPVKWMLSRSYRKWVYCVQYRETDANFMQRLLEHEGIWFWFDHTPGEHTLVITDDIGLASPYPGYATIPFYPHDHTVPDKDHLHGWAAGGNVQSGKYSARDYNFVMPSADLTTRRTNPAGIRMPPTTFSTIRAAIRRWVKASRMRACAWKNCSPATSAATAKGAPAALRRADYSRWRSTRSVPTTGNTWSLPPSTISATTTMRRMTAAANTS